MTKANTKKDLINDVLKVFKETNNTTRENYLQYGKYSRAPINRLFGNWNNLLDELGYDINMYKNVTKEDVIANMNDLINQFGYVNSTIQRKYGKYSQTIIDSLFGNWSNLAKELNQKIDGRFISDEEIKTNLLHIYKEYNHMSKYLIDNYCIVSHPTIINRFGNLQNICDELEIPLYTEAPISKLCSYALGIISSELNEEPKLEYTFPWLINPNTKAKLRIDAYYPKHNLAVEVDGQQHTSKDSFYNKSEKYLEIYQQRDKIKDELLKNHNINLVRISYKDKLNDIKLKIKPFKSN